MQETKPDPLCDAEKKIDKFLLLYSSIILVYLKKRWDDEKYYWGSIVEKSEKWIGKKIEEGKPMIYGSEPMIWVEKYIEELRLTIFTKTLVLEIRHVLFFNLHAII